MILTTAKASGYRAIQDDARVAGYLANSPAYPRIWLKEQLAGLNMPELLQKLDMYAATEQSSQMLLELADAFALQRDSKYMFRSRKWLYTRGYGSRAKRNYEMLVAYMNENPTHDNKALIKADPTKLAAVSVEDALDLTPGKTKSSQMKTLILSTPRAKTI